MPANLTALLLGSIAAAIVLVLAMTGAWLVQRRTGNAGWSDAFWSFGTGAACVLVALLPVAGSGWPTTRQLIVALAAAVWSLRLGSHIAARSRAAKEEDARYAALRREWGADFQRRLYVFLLIQAGAGWLLTLPVLAAAQNPRPGLTWQDGLAIAIFVAAVIGESVADRQMRAFREAHAGEHGRICDTGLWAWSRHPNYFFEWLGWCAYPVMALGPFYPLGWLSLVGPLLMYWLLVHVSGIPLLEQHLAASRPDAFRRYAERVPAFFPRPPRG